MVWAPDYVTTADVRAYLRVTDSADDAQYARWATASSRAVDKLCNRQFGQSVGAATRVYRRPPAYDPTTGLWLLEIDDLYDATGLLINGVAPGASAVLLPDNAGLGGRPYERIGLTAWPIYSTPGFSVAYSITSAYWGWPAVPTQVPAACLLQAARWNFRRDAPAGVAGSPEQGSEVRMLAKLDPDVSTSLVGLARRRGIA